MSAAAILGHLCLATREIAARGLQRQKKQNYFCRGNDHATAAGTETMNSGVSLRFQINRPRSGSHPPLIPFLRRIL
jgi:hypothetical protein